MNQKEIKTKALEVLNPIKTFNHQCHAASIALVKAGIGTRVARGFCPKVGGQHSWVVQGDCYNPEYIIDPTLWSYDKKVKGIYVGKGLGHTPHGTGSIWDWGKPNTTGGKEIKLTPAFQLSEDAEYWLCMFGELDLIGWMAVSSAPVEDWPAGEILAAMDDTKELTALVPIDKLGMLTDRNPGGLYLP